LSRACDAVGDLIGKADQRLAALDAQRRECDAEIQRIEAERAEVQRLRTELCEARDLAMAASFTLPVLQR
jgi:septal ring factor EnvC (AmiA/AmiB activator)